MRKRDAQKLVAKIKQYPITLIEVRKIKRDPDNPNVLTEDQKNGLRESFKRFGFLQPIILNEDFLIADGEHRLDIYEEFKEEKVPAYVIPLSEEERRLIRQAMNKIRGEHDIIKDVKELQFLMKNRSEDLQALLKIDAQRITDMRSLATYPTEEQWKELFKSTLREDGAEDLEKYHSITVHLTEKDFDNALEIMESISPNRSDAFMELIRNWKQ